MSEIDLVQYAQNHVGNLKTMYAKDLEALSQEQLTSSFAGAARTAVDFTYEVIVINRRIASRLRGEDPGALPWEAGKEWAVAPESHRSKEALIADFNASADELIAAVAGDPLRKIVTPMGEQTALELAVFAAMHIGYHGGQLNYIQSLHGDAGIHWM